MRLFLLIILVSPFVLLSQNNKAVFVETGTCFNTAAVKQFHTKDKGGSTTRFEYKGTIKSVASYYIKGGFEKLINLCPKSQISFPISFTYFNEAQKIQAVGGWSGCTGSEGGNYTIKRNNHTAAVSMGVKFISKLNEKFSLQNGFNFSPTILAYREDNIKVVNEIGTTGYYSGYGLVKLNMTISAQAGIFYELNPSTKLGLTGEYFFFTKQIKPKSDFPFEYIDDYEAGYHGHSALLNVGLRLQHSF